MLATAGDDLGYAMKSLFGVPEPLTGAEDVYLALLPRFPRKESLPLHFITKARAASVLLLTGPRFQL